MIISCFVYPSLAQTPTDATLMAKGEFCIALSYSSENWEKYWEGTLKRDNGNIGTFTRQTIMPMLALGLTEKITTIAALPWMQTEASAGQMRGAEGLQDWGVWIKGEALQHSFAVSTLKVQAVAGATEPASNYLPDYAPFNLGLGCLEGSLRGIVQYEHQRWYTRAQMGYHFRGNSTIERNYYYTTTGYYTDQVAIPNAITYSYSMGAWVLPQSLRAELTYDSLTTLGGHDIRRQDVGFPSNKMIFTRVGATLQYQIPKFNSFGVLASGSYIVNGRNVGQSSVFSFGLLYRFGLFGNHNSNSITN
jgi:hypothetical protein